MVWESLADVNTDKLGNTFRTRPLIIPRPLVRRAAAFAEVGLDVSLMPSAALGIESLPPMMKVAKVRSVNVGGGDGVMSSVIAVFASGFRIRESLNYYHVLACFPTSIRQGRLNSLD